VFFVNILVDPYEILTSRVQIFKTAQKFVKIPIVKYQFRLNMLMETRFLIIIPKVPFISIFTKTTFFNKQKLFKKEFTRVDYVWLHFLEVLDPKCIQLGEKSCLEISI